jgi:hypothetical protein
MRSSNLSSGSNELLHTSLEFGCVYAVPPIFTNSEISDLTDRFTEK